MRLESFSTIQDETLLCKPCHLVALLISRANWQPRVRPAKYREGMHQSLFDFINNRHIRRLWNSFIWSEEVYFGVSTESSAQVSSYSRSPGFMSECSSPIFRVRFTWTGTTIRARRRRTSLRSPPSDSARSPRSSRAGSRIRAGRNPGPVAAFVRWVNDRLQFHGITIARTGQSQIR